MGRSGRTRGMSDLTERSPTITLDTARTPADWSTARLLVLDLISWIAEHAGLDMRSGQVGFADEIADLSKTYSPPGGRFLIARVDGVAAGSVALRHHGDGVAELKRMYVRPGARGLSLGDRLVRRILELAAWDRRRLVWLETGAGIMDPAIRIYRRHGFVERPTTDPTIDHPALITMERPLVDLGALS